MMFMDALHIKEALKEAVEALRKTPPTQRRDNASYSLAVRSGYEDIKQLREDGYSYDVICEALSEKGVLQPNAKPKNLCSAFLRETKRREKRAMRANSSNRAEGKSPMGMKTGSQVTPEKTTAPAREKLTVNPDNTFNIRPSALTESDIDAIEKERLRKLAEPKYKNAWGDTITRHSNGSFDID
jgi:hypothetical protein